MKRESFQRAGVAAGVCMAAIAASTVPAAAQEQKIDAPPESMNMRLVGYNVRLLVADLSDPLPPGPFDLVVSVLAIHHLDGPGKAALFRRVAEVLSPGGRFVLGDAVIPATPGGEVIPMEAGYDKPSTVAEQVGWLHDAGLVAVVRWEEDDLAVVTADRPSVPY